MFHSILLVMMIQIVCNSITSYYHRVTKYLSHQKRRFVLSCFHQQLSSNNFSWIKFSWKRHLRHKTQLWCYYFSGNKSQPEPRKKTDIKMFTGSQYVAEWQSNVEVLVANPLETDDCCDIVHIVTCSWSI